MEENPLTNNDMLTIEEVAKKCHISEDSVQRFIRSGKLKAVKMGYRITRICPSDLDLFIEARKGDNYFDN